MAEYKSTARPKFAGAIALGTVLFLFGCNSNPRTRFLEKRTIVHVSHVGSGDRLPINPVLARSNGLDIVRR